MVPSFECTRRICTKIFPLLKDSRSIRYSTQFLYCTNDAIYGESIDFEQEDFPSCFVGGRCTVYTVEYKICSTQANYGRSRRITFAFTLFYFLTNCTKITGIDQSARIGNFPVSGRLSGRYWELFSARPWHWGCICELPSL